MKLVAFRTPPDHTYVDAPTPVSVALVPEQTAAELLVAVTVGNTLTVIVFVAVFIQPFASVPVTVYVAVDVGMKLVAFRTPPDHTYVDAPTPVSVALVPEQTAAALLVAVTVGNALTVIVFVAVFIQPFASVPVTVYVAVDVGMKLVAFRTPPDHTYVDAPTPVSVALVPEQTAAELLVAVTVGNTLTVIVSVVEDAHCVEGLKVYVVVAKLLRAGDQFPEIPLVETVGKGASVCPTQIGLTELNIGVVILLQYVIRT
jgi:hypothetical protein